MRPATRMFVIRTTDALLSAMGLVVLLPLMLLLAAFGWFDTRSPLFRQVRVGRDQRPFTLLKFRTMRPGTAQVATHLAESAAVTRFGAFLRRTKLDELPQLWNVLKGEMSLVGPRPCLPSQTELIAVRAHRGVFAMRPGITGLAQIRGIDMSNPERLTKVDAEMIRSWSVALYWRCLLATVIGRGRGDRVRG